MEVGGEGKGERGGSASRFGGAFIPPLPGTPRESRKQMMPQFPFVPEPQEGPFFLSPLLLLTYPSSPQKPPVPILITPNSALNKVFIRLTAFVFLFLLIKSGNVGKKYGWVTGFLMVPHLKCILKYVNQ